VKLSAVTDYGNRTVLSSSFTTPFAVAVDGSGNVWVADKGTTSVTELSPAGAVTGTFGSFSSPEGIAVDPAGNVYVSDNGGSSITELTKATNFATTVTLASSTSTPAVATPVGVALDSHGNVYYANGDGTVEEINLTTAPTLAFGNEPYGTLSAPQSVILSNIGNADLNFTNIQTTTDYVNVGTGGDCVVGTPVTAGGSCPLAITFTPTSIGSDPGTATLTDVAIPNPQVISLSGSGTQATPTLSVTNSPVTYNGAPQAATVTGSVAGTVSNVLYNGSATVPTTAGTYPITANFTPSNPADYATLTAASAGSFVISKATPTLSITNTPAPYTGNPVAATVVGSVGGTVSAVLYGGSATVPTAAGTYAVTASFTPSDTTDYNSLTAASAGSFVIGKVTPTLSISNSPVTYTGAAQAATVTGSVGGSVSNVLYNGSATVPITAGTYAVTANFTPTDTADYNTLTAASAGNFVINKATLTLSITNSPATYTGAGQSATIVATATGITGTVAGTPGAVLYNGSATLPVAAGTYPVTANFAPTDVNDFNTVTAGSAGNFVIGKATPTLSVTNSPVTYNGNPQSATVTGSVGGTVSSVLYNGSATVPTAGGTYAITASFTPTDATDYNTLTAASAGNFIINKATPTLSVTNSPVNYTGTAQAAVVTGSVPGNVSAVLYNGSATVPIAAGTYAITASFTPTDGTDYASLTAASAGNFIINTIAPTITFAVPNHTFGDAPFVVSATSNSTGAITYSVVSGPATIAGATVTLTGAGTVVLKATQAAAGNYTTGSQNATFTVTTNTPTITWHAPASIAYGTPLSATQLDATASVGGSFTYTPVAGTILPVGAGQTLSVLFTPTDTTDYKTVTGTTTITVTASALTVSANNATRVYGTANPAFTGTVTGQQNGDTFTESFTTTATTTSNAGTYPIVPSPAGSNLADYTVVIDNGTLTITKANSTTSLSAGGASANPGASVTLTATVASATSGTPTGTVTFYDGTTMLGTGTLSGGVATYSTTTLAAGASNTLTAVYGGDVNFNGSTSASTVITVGVLDFTLGTPNPATQTGSAGTAFTYSFSISPVYANYAGTVSFAATGLPAGGVATFSPSTIAANGGPQTVTMIVNTAAGSAALVKPATPGRGLIPVALAFLLLPLAGTKRMRREGRRFGRMACLMLLVLAGLGATAAITGCGSHAGNTTNNGQSYTITITATSGAIQHTSTVTLDLQ
jgi:Bacterial Ig-like domain (group 3)/MBG domain (YGX type)/MBG domain/NHL repeat